MQTIREVAALREAIGAFRAAGERVALVPTMGALHAGHMALIEEAKRVATRIVASIFVNPKQFGPDEDLDRYPRREGADARMLADAGCDVLWMPTVETMYPAGFATNVSVAASARCSTARRDPGISMASPPLSPSCSIRCGPTSPCSATRTSSSSR